MWITTLLIRITWYPSNRNTEQSKMNDLVGHRPAPVGSQVGLSLERLLHTPHHVFLCQTLKHDAAAARSTISFSARFLSKQSQHSGTCRGIGGILKCHRIVAGCCLRSDPECCKQQKKQETRQSPEFELQCWYILILK